MSRETIAAGAKMLVKEATQDTSRLATVAEEAATIASANPIAAGVLLGVAALTAGAALIYQEVQHYEKAKHEAEIKRVIAFWETSGLKALGIHPPFEFTGDNGETLKTHCFEKKRGRDTALRDPLPLELTNYRVKIDEAIRGLRNYIENGSHGHGSGMSTLVANYLLNILESDALRFEGRDHEIALTAALSHFTCQYARDENNTHTQRITYLSQVFISLEKACHELKRHQKSKPFLEVIQETLGTLRDSGDQLIRFLVKFVTPSKHWNIINQQTLKFLKAGVVAPNPHERLFLSIPDPRSTEDKIPSTFMDRWFHLLIQYYEQSRNPDTLAIQIPPMSAFTVPSIEALTQEARKWRNIFENSDNFLTRELDPNESDPSRKKLIPIQDIVKIRQRLCLMADIAVLLHITCTLQSHFTALHHFANSFGVNAAEAKQYEDYYEALWKVCRKFTNQIQHIITEYDAIKEANDQMPEFSHMEFERAFVELISDMEQKLKNGKLGIERSRKRFRDTTHPTETGTEHALTSHIHKTMAIYNMSSDEHDPVAAAVVHPSDSPSEPIVHPIVDRSEIVRSPINDDASSVASEEDHDSSATHSRQSRPIPLEAVASAAPTKDEIHAVYRRKCKGTSLVQLSIFGPTKTAQDTIQEMRTRMTKNPNGASAMTIQELEDAGRIARVQHAM